MFQLARFMNSDRRFIADTSWRRPENGTVVLAGSPLTLFSLSQAGALFSLLKKIPHHDENACYYDPRRSNKNADAPMILQ